MVVNVEKLLKMVIFQNLSKNGEMVKNVDENIKNFFIALIIFYTLDIKNIIFNPKFYQHFFAISSNHTEPLHQWRCCTKLERFLTNAQM